MGKVVGAFMVPHNPIMFFQPEAPAVQIQHRIRDAFKQCSQRLAGLNATAVVIVGADHYINFGTECLPQYLIATGDIDGPIDTLPGLDRRPIQSHQALAAHIAAHGHQSGYDWAVARAITVDHAISIPDRLIVDPVREQGQSIGTIPVYIASGVDPYISIKRAFELGNAIKTAVSEADEHERVVVIASGGLSHWVGLPEMGKVNEQFDHQIMDYACTGNIDAMAQLSDAYILAHGGNGGMEIRQWAVAMGAMPGAQGEIIEYAPVTEWITGLGFVQLHS